MTEEAVVRVLLCSEKLRDSSSSEMSVWGELGWEERESWLLKGEDGQRDGAPVDIGCARVCARRQESESHGG